MPFDYVPQNESHHTDCIAPAKVVHEYLLSEKDQQAKLFNPTSLRSIAKKHLKTMTKPELDANWRLDEFFETIFVVNLPQSSQRLNKMTQELHGISTKRFEVFKAIDGRNELAPEIWQKFYLNLHGIGNDTEEGKRALDDLHKGQVGCYMSHYTILQKVHHAFQTALNDLEAAKRAQNRTAIKKHTKTVRKYSRVLILEDDGGFGILDNATQTVSKKGVGRILRKALSKLPDDWDMLYFVVHATEPTEKVATHLRKLHRSWSMLAYAINHHMYEPLLKRLQKIEDPDTTKIWPVDNEISEIHHEHKVYAIYPSIVFTQAGKSNITGKTWDAWQGQPIYPHE